MNKIPLMNLKDGLVEIRDEINSKVTELIDNTSFVGGKEIDSFEQEYAEFSNIKYAVGCSNGTDAIEVGLTALGIGIGDSVVVPANSFIATAEAVTNVGADVVFVDVDDEYYTMDPVKLEEVLVNDTAKKIKAVVPVHLYGQMADMEKIMEVANRYNLKVLEDSAQAQGATFNGFPPGYYGDLATYSFYPGKNLGAFGDAGAITTNDEKIYEKCRMIVNHGRKQGSKYEHDIVGGNKRIDTLQAAILRIKLRKLGEWTDLRREKIKRYSDNLKDKGLILPKAKEGANPVWHLYVIRTSNRDELLKTMSDNNISCGIHYPIPLHLQPAYSFLNHKTGDFPITEKHAEEIISLPLWPEISNEDIDRVCSLV